jgi:uncharacterized DUF497 family protein
MTKKELIRKHLKTHGSITTWEAIGHYRVTRLSGIIYELRREGLNIISIPSRSKSHFVTYSLEEPK